jgi:hypothetical protein
VTYIVTYGAKGAKNRKSDRFLKEDNAVEFFKEKEKAGLYCDAFREEVKTITTMTKLTK